MSLEESSMTLAKLRIAITYEANERLVEHPFDLYWSEKVKII